MRPLSAEIAARSKALYPLCHVVQNPIDVTGFYHD